MDYVYCVLITAVICLPAGYLFGGRAKAAILLEIKTLLGEIKAKLP